MLTLNLFPLLPIAFILLVIVIIVLNHVSTAKRRKELAAWALSKGLSFDPAKVKDLDSRFPAFDCLRQGSNRYAENIIQGQWGTRSFLGFDYHYETHSTGAKGQHHTQRFSFSAVVIGSPVPLKPLFIRPEGISDKIAEFFGVDDIDFESAEFSRKFLVKAEDKKWAYGVIHQRTMEYLLSAPRFTIQFSSDCAIAHRGSRFSANDFDAAAQTLDGIFSLLPDYLVKQQQEEA